MTYMLSLDDSLERNTVFLLVKYFLKNNIILCVIFWYMLEDGKFRDEQISFAGQEARDRTKHETTD